MLSLPALCSQEVLSELARNSDGSLDVLGIEGDTLAPCHSQCLFLQEFDTNKTHCKDQVVVLEG